jgi:hypothetical protein
MGVTVNPCPDCGALLEPVHSAKGDLLGYFCKGVLVKSCTYINVKSTAEHENELKYAKKEG